MKEIGDSIKFKTPIGIQSGKIEAYDGKRYQVTGDDNRMYVVDEHVEAEGAAILPKPVAKKKVSKKK